jgi:hypothetical protein
MSTKTKYHFVHFYLHFWHITFSIEITLWAHPETQFGFRIFYHFQAGGKILIKFVINFPDFILPVAGILPAIINNLGLKRFITPFDNQFIINFRYAVFEFFFINAGTIIEPAIILNPDTQRSNANIIDIFIESIGDIFRIITGANDSFVCGVGAAGFDRTTSQIAAIDFIAFDKVVGCRELYAPKSTCIFCK